MDLSSVGLNCEWLWKVNLKKSNLTRSFCLVTIKLFDTQSGIKGTQPYVEESVSAREKPMWSNG